MATASAVAYGTVTLVGPAPPRGAGPSAIAYATVTLIEPPPAGGFAPSAIAYATVTLTASVAPFVVSYDGIERLPGWPVHWTGTAWT